MATVHSTVVLFVLALAGPVAAGILPGDVDSIKYDGNATKNVGVSCPVTIIEGCAFSRSSGPIQLGDIVFGHAFVDNQPLPGGSESDYLINVFSSAVSINDHGEIAGDLVSVDITTSFNSIMGHKGVVWANGQIIRVGSGDSLAFYIDNAGNVVTLDDSGMFSLVNIHTGLITPFDFGRGMGFTNIGGALHIDNLLASAVPEPATWAMMVVGMMGLVGLRRRL